VPGWSCIPALSLSEPSGFLACVPPLTGRSSSPECSRALISSKPRRRRPSRKTSGTVFLSIDSVRRTRSSSSPPTSTTSKAYSGLPWVAPCCTVLRSRWCQSGVRRS
jgi:hypothetical protein